MPKELVLTAIVRKERDGYAAWCPELDVASQGDTVEDARKNLKEAVEVHVETLLADGRLDDLLDQIGMTRDEFKKKHLVVPESFSGSFGIPLAV